MSLTIKTKNLHLLWRAGFGPAVEQLGDLDKYSPKQFYKALQKASEKKPEYIDVADDYLKGLWLGIEEAGRQQKKEMDADERKMVQQKNRQGVRSLNMYWMHEMVNTGAQLREKLSFFWHGHFACRNLNVFYQQGLLDILRRNALGSFRTMLHEVSKSAAMLNFLNNQQNRKDHPNENFAREVMELFTLGRGNYSENDIKEAARSFTGWASNAKGEYVFRRFQHDFGNKTVLGKSGNLTGEQVLDHLLAQKQTAKFITGKLYKFFVNETPDEKNIDWLADRFYKNDYDIGKLCEDIFTSEWFYEDKNIGAKIKSPVDLLVGIQRMLPMKLENEEALMLLQRVLGQLLFYPPNVAGWPGGKAWIDSSTLMMRMRIPQMLNDEDEMNVKPKDDDDTMMGMMNKKNDKNENPKVKGQKQMGRLGKPILVNIDWSKYVKYYDPVKRERLLDEMNRLLLVTRKGVSDDLIKKFSDETARDNFIKSATLQIMSTPEYQLC
jgi:uncharacterized protein (DUF1800 family)